MKSLKPSTKENKRYLLIEGDNLKEEIKKAVLDFIGVLGYSKSGLSFIFPKKKSIVLCINREMINYVRASFAVWPKEIKVKNVCGTLKGLTKKTNSKKN